ncbi:MAG: YajQ family cyclic di-GMP-binding protein [Gammaproteobacteria bacterium]
MPSFDIVTEIDNHELVNAIDQANREVGTRFDFKDSGALYELKDDKILIKAQNEFQVKQMQEILNLKLSKRGLDIRSLELGKIETALHEARLTITVKKGIKQDFAKKITKLIKESNLKVQASIQGEQIRVTGKKRDDLQDAIALLKDGKLEQPLQYTNFRD